LRIGIVTSEGLNTSLGTSATVLGFATGLSSMGHEVHVLAPGQPSKKMNQNLSIDGYGGHLAVHTQSLTKRAYASRRFARKTVLRPRMLKAVIRNLERYVTRWAKQLRLDIIEGHQELAASACISVASKLRIQSVSRFHNVWFEECLELGLLSETDNEFQFLKGLTASVIEHSGSIITPTQYMKEYFRTNFAISDRSRIVPVPPGICARQRPTLRSTQEKRTVYSGSLNELEGLSLYLEAASLAPKSLEVSICGKGSKSTIAQFEHSLGQRLHLHWFERREDYLEYLSNCQLGVVPWGWGQSRRLGFPMKLLDYVAVGLPVIASKIGSWSDLVETLGFGMLSEPNPVDWAECFRRIMEDEPLRQSMSIKAWEASNDEFSSDKAIAKVLKVYEELL